MRFALRSIVAGVAALMIAWTAARAQVPPPAPQVLFVCEHGNVKSLMAASYFNQLASKRGLNVRAISRGSAPDSTTVPSSIVAGLHADGLEVGDFRPVAVSAADISASDRVVTISTDLPADVSAPASKVERWDDVPPASTDYAAARDALRTHVAQLLGQLSRDKSKQEPATLSIEAKIPLGTVEGRIDHLAIDPGRRFLFIAELGNNSVGVVDIESRKLVRTLTGLDEPQGIAYEQATDTLYVANGGDGSLRAFRGPQLVPAGTIKLGADADNVRIEPAHGRMYVGYGDGALAVIDTASHRKIADIPLEAHPESFQLEPTGSRIFVNVPRAHAIAVVDARSNKQIASWPTKELRANYPMAVDDATHQVLAAFREPALLAAFDMADGGLLSRTSICSDADDLFVDAKRRYVYVSCGEGFIDVLAEQARTYGRIARIETAKGARTAFYSADLDRFFLAVRATTDEQAAVWVFRPK